jgi:curved DNA-binding protein CbpA
MIKDYYHLLGVPRGAPLEEIKTAYRRLARECHPDKVAQLTREEQQAATVTMRELNEALDTFSDPRRRAEYDETIRLIPERKPRSGVRVPAAAPPPRTTSPPPAPQPATAAQPSPSAAASKPPVPAPPAPESRGLNREEQVKKWQEVLRQLPLEWREIEARNWQWAWEATSFRRRMVVAYRHQENLSLLSIRTLVGALERLVEQHRSSLRSTVVIALVTSERLMDVRTVVEQLQVFVSNQRGWPRSAHSVVLVADEQSGRVEIFGSVGGDPVAERALHHLLKARA